MTDPIDVTPVILREIRALQATMAAQIAALHADVSDMKADICDMRGGFNRRFEVLEALVIRHDARFDTLEVAIEGLSAQVRMLSAGVTASLTARERTAIELERLDGRVEGLEGRVGVLEARED